MIPILLLALAAEEPVRVLIVDGRNNHQWAATTTAMRGTLLQAGRFHVDVSTAPPRYPKPQPRRPSKGTPEEMKAWEAEMEKYKAANRKYEASIRGKWASWRPAFEKYDVVISNYNGPDWPEPVRTSLEKYISGGGGLIIIHGATNCFVNWDAYNKMMGVGWRKSYHGPRLTIDDTTGRQVLQPKDEGPHSGHGSKHPFVVKTRAADHPVMRGLPAEWLHGQDELYHAMRGPAEGVTVLATAWSDPKQRGSGLHEPVVWTTAYGKGRVLTTSLGHNWGGSGPNTRDSLHCVGFQAILARSAEWAATGKVTIAPPKAFPSTDAVSIEFPEWVDWGGGLPDWKLRKARNPYSMLKPEEAIGAMETAGDFRIEVVVSEPHVREPVLAAWDGNGRLYVAEMRSYMQDEKGARTKSMRNGRVSRHEDTDGDGRMDRHTVFVDKLNLPRMVLPLDDRVAIVETDSTDVWSYRDTDGDGVADEKKLLHKGDRKIDPSRSVEHQDSGLFWSIDNWIYLSRGRVRYRFTRGKWETGPIEFSWNQWGLDQDDTGRLFFADNSHPGEEFQQHPIYWNLVKKRAKGGWRPPTVGPDYDPSYLEMHSICKYGDRGGSHASRSFTSASGACVYRGEALNAYGDFFTCDPTGHIVRRARVANDRGRRTLVNATPGREFIASTDINFRPVEVHTGPDGGLYVVDMYRGMIQDAPWVNPAMEQFLRDTGLNHNIGCGRIYRVISGKRGATPRMLDEPTAKLVGHLEHPNGWWRDTAQKLIILRKDRETVLPALRKMAVGGDNPLGRLQALWTLEGCDAVDADLVRAALKDRDPRVREGGARISEGIDPLLLAAIVDDPHPDVARQAILSLGTSDAPQSIQLIERVIENHLDNEVVTLAAMTALYDRKTPLIQRMLAGGVFGRIADPVTQANTRQRWMGGIARWDANRTPPRKLKPDEVKFVARGAEFYRELCIACHGPDGRGLPPNVAPSLVGSDRVLGPKERLIRLILHGLTGPVEGREYAGGIMAPLGGRDDAYIASVLSYIRGEWGNLAPVITPEEVAVIRDAEKRRTAPWTLEELVRFAPPKLDRKGWKVASSAGNTAAAVDGNKSPCDMQNRPGSWYQVDLGKSSLIARVVLDANNDDRYPRRYEIRVSDDGKTWSEPVAAGAGSASVTDITFEPVAARHVKILQTGESKHHRWALAELNIHGIEPGAAAETPQRAPLPPVDRLVTMTGNAAAGKPVFERLCAQCHTRGDLGTAFGPDLTDAAKRLTRKQIFESILDPNAVIAEGFQAETLRTRDGAIHSGIVKVEGDTLVVRSRDKTVTLRSADVARRVRQTVSTMPSGMEWAMSQQELLDLAAWLHPDSR